MYPHTIPVHKEASIMVWVFAFRKREKLTVEGGHAWNKNRVYLDRLPVASKGMCKTLRL